MTTTKTQLLSLTVAEALSKDVGRGIARLDPQDMKTIGAHVGDIIRVEGGRTTAAKVMPAYAEDRGKGAVQIDGITRENARVGLGEQVRVQKTPFEEAGVVVLAPAARSNAFMPGKDAGYLERVLESLPVSQGDRIRATLFGGRYLEFSVTETDPGDIVVIGPSTVVKVKGEDAPSGEKGGTTYEDIGALHRELQRIREMIELPLDSA